MRSGRGDRLDACSAAGGGLSRARSHCHRARWWAERWSLLDRRCWQHRKHWCRTTQYRYCGTGVRTRQRRKSSRSHSPVHAHARLHWVAVSRHSHGRSDSDSGGADLAAGPLGGCRDRRPRRSTTTCEPADSTIEPLHSSPQKQEAHLSDEKPHTEQSPCVHAKSRAEVEQLSLT